jgi:hypothetical protein
MNTEFHIIHWCGGFIIAELQLDQCLSPLNKEPMVSLEAAERLRDELTTGKCPFELTTPSGDYDPGEHVARCYDVASRIVPLLPKSDDAWGVALRIASASPWERPLPNDRAIDVDYPLPF